MCVTLILSLSIGGLGATLAVFFWLSSYNSNLIYVYSCFSVQDQATSDKPDLAAAYRRRVPSDPMEHGPGKVGISSRWWYLPGMYKPVAHCGRCTKPPPGITTGVAFANALRHRQEVAVSGVTATVERTGQLYRIPRIRPAGTTYRVWSRECVTWPRFDAGHYALHHTIGDTLLELSLEEARALQIVVLKTNTQAETFSVHGPGHHQNWKKVGLSRAYFKPELVQESSMPTDKAKAAFRFLREHNRYYQAFLQTQAGLIATHASLNVLSWFSSLEENAWRASMFSFSISSVWDPCVHRTVILCLKSIFSM